MANRIIETAHYSREQREGTLERISQAEYMEHLKASRAAAETLHAAAGDRIRRVEAQRDALIWGCCLLASAVTYLAWLLWRG